MYALLALCARPQGEVASQGEATYYQHLAQTAAKFVDWTDISTQAERHGLGPLLYTHLQAVDVSLPQDVKRELQALYLRHQHANRVRMLLELK